MTDPDPELLELAWEFLAQEWEVLQKMCAIAARKDRLRRDTWEEAMSEVALRLPEVMWSYDPTRGRSLRSHVIGNIRWYLYKMFVSERDGRNVDRAKRGFEVIAQERVLVVLDDKSELFDWDEVQYVLDKLHPFHASVLKLYYMSGLTYEEIGGVLECSKSAARKRVIEALTIAQEHARGLDARTAD